MEPNEYELTVIPGRRPIWKTILATAFFSFMIYTIYRLGCICWAGKIGQLSPKHWKGFIFTISYCFSGGVSFSIMKTVLIDVDKDKLVSRFFIGPFQKDVLTKVPDLQYVSVFQTSKGYQVNLWYNGNKHYSMYMLEEKLPAFELATLVSKKLKLSLLDATQKGNYKWIEKAIA